MTTQREKRAARRVMEFEGLSLRLSDAYTDAIDIVNRVGRTQSHDYLLDSSAVRRVALHEAEWATYRYASLLHALDELVKDTSLVRVSSNEFVKSTASGLIAIRNCIHHNGPVGANYDKSGSEVVVELSTLERRGDWDAAGVAPFSAYFPSYRRNGPPQFIELGRTIEESEEAYTTLVTTVVSKIESKIGEERLKRAAASVTLYS
jgi:hypothetical protein